MNVPYLDVGAAWRELEPEIDAAARSVFRSGRYIFGPQLEAFEREFADYCGARACVGVGNGLDAIRLLLAGHQLGAGAEVIVPSNTYIATWLGVSLAGAVPVPVEPIEGTYCLDPERVERAITPRTRAILAVHLYGFPADMTALREIAARRDLRLFEDAAQAHGAQHAGERAGSLGDGAAFSFYPGKNLGAFGDGGAVTTNDELVAARIRRLRNYGERERYVNDELGINSRLDELQAACLRVRLPHLDAWNDRRRRIATLYLASLGGLGLPDPVARGDRRVWHVFPVRVSASRRDLVRGRLADRGVTTLVHYPIPPHLQRAYQHLRFGRGDFPIAERLAGEEISLPIGPHLSEADAERVIAEVRAAL